PPRALVSTSVRVIQVTAATLPTVGTQRTILVTQLTITMLVTQATPTTRLIPVTMVRTAILATATVMAVLTSELIGSKVDGLRAETKGRFAWACAAYKAVSGCYLHTSVAAKS